MRTLIKFLPPLDFSIRLKNIFSSKRLLIVRNPKGNSVFTVCVYPRFHRSPEITLFKSLS